MKLTHEGWKLDTNDNRALKHTNKKDMFEVIKKIELGLQRLTWNGMSYNEREISTLINESTQHLYYE